MHIALKLHGHPGFHPDHADVPAPPPPGTVVTIGSDEFTVQTLRLTGAKRPHSGGGEDWTWHYAAELASPPYAPLADIVRAVQVLHTAGAGNRCEQCGMHAPCPTAVIVGPYVPPTPRRPEPTT